MAINHGVLSEKGNGKDRAKSIPKLIRESLMKVIEVALIDDSFLACLHSSGRACRFAFEESNTRPD